MAKIIITLTKAELNLLLALVYDNIDEGRYWGRKDHFMKRQESVLQKLQEGLGE